VIPAEKYTFPDFSLFWNDEKARNVEKAVEANRGKYLYGGPDAMFWEILWHLYGTEDALIAMIDEPEKVQGLFEKNYELLIKFVDKCCEYPVEAILLSDDIADQRGPLFGLERWRELEKPFIKKLYDYIHSKGKKVMTHICGSVRPFIPDLIDIGQDLIESVQPEAAGMNPYELKSEFGNDLCFWGCLGCQSAATFFTPGKLRDEIKRLKENMYRGGGFILSPTKPLNIMVPLENMDVILEEFCEG
jgi:uroporphyrinogen decarboxylase